MLFPYRIIRFLFAGALLAAPVFAQTDDAVKTDVENLKKEIDTLKKQQFAIIQQLGQLAQMVRRQQTAQNPVVDLKDAPPPTGSATAKVAIVEFTDFWCGFCARYATQTLPEIRKKYVDTGKIRYYVKDFPAQRGSHVAEAARCTGDHYWAMHDQLFSHFGKYSDEELTKYATEAGANPESFTKCLASTEFSKIVQSGMQTGSDLGVDGTPTFMIGTIDPEDPTKLKTVRTIVGAQKIESFQAALDSAVAEAR
jgi:protein-disulfide isomerase